ncbi:MAG: 2-oxoacid:acceptor oxidoreductase family protein [Desulfotomaculaceae bacterium]|nr:2-oxoacid:acceptor oxidoreductase family protein [Desulfotomaculaceae bacterium]
MSTTIKIAMAGEGGQGVQSVAEIIAAAANEEGKECLYIPNFGVEQRGGVSIAFVQISSEAIGAPKFNTGDIVVALSERAIARTLQYVGPKTTFVYDTSLDVSAEDLPKNAKKILGIPAVEISKNELSPRVFNIIIMGAVVGATGVISVEGAKRAIEKQLGAKFEKQPKLRELNFNAIDRGIDLVTQAG